MKDIFRPHTQPAQLIYDAFQKEARKRLGKKIPEWIEAERLAVWEAARDYANQHGLQIPTLVEIQTVEDMSIGSADYGAKWAYGVARLLERKANVTDLR